MLNYYSSVLNLLFAALLGVLFTTALAVASTNNITLSTNLSGTNSSAARPDPIQAELSPILSADDKAREEIDKWIRDAEAFKSQGAGSPQTTLNLRIEEKLKEVKKQYEEFIKKYPTNAPVRLAFGSFLEESGEEQEAAFQWEKARELDPKNPATWNNLANYYGHNSPVTKAFDYYARAIELNPKEPVYFQNFATTVYLFRKDAMEHYKISETEVFDKALNLYKKAVALAPDDFVLYSDYAQSYYGTKPPRYADGLKAWQEARKIARDDIERDGATVHIARCRIHLGELDPAQKDLNSVTNEMYTELKTKLLKQIENRKTASSTKDEGRSD